MLLCRFGTTSMQREVARAMAKGDMEGFAMSSDTRRFCGMASMQHHA